GARDRPTGQHCRALGRDVRLADPFAVAGKDGTQLAPLDAHDRLLPAHRRMSGVNLLDVEKCGRKLVGCQWTRRLERHEQDEASARARAGAARAHAFRPGTTISYSAPSCCRRMVSHSSATFSKRRRSTRASISTKGGRYAGWRSWIQTRW